MHHHSIRDLWIRTEVNKQQHRLFTDDLSKVSLKFWESQSDGYKTQLKFDEVTSVDELELHLEQNEGNAPIVRHVFLSAGNSQKPLKCTFDAFSLLCACHQVAAEFENLLLSFGEPVGGFVGLHQPRCHLELRPSSATQSQGSSPTLGLGDSQREMRNCYRLSAMETSRDGKSMVMRQIAVYHSFNLSTGKSFTMTAKANPNEICERIRSLNGGSAPRAMTESFTASLETQLIALGWCTEGWTSHINALELQVRQTSTKITATPLPTADKILIKGLTTNEKTGHGSSRQTASKSQGTYLSYFRRLMRFSSRANPSATDISMNSIRRGSNAGDLSAVERLDKVAQKQLEALNEFPFESLQDLHSASAKLREAKLVMDLNAQALREIGEHYQAAFNSGDIPEKIKESCGLVHRTFQQRVKYLEKLLKMECLRVDTLTQVVNDGNGLYGSILQLQGGQVGQLFAMDARNAASRMESMTQNMHEIARNTEKDTSSMHVITFFALVFLPGTFLGVRYYCQHHHTKPTRESMPSYLTQNQSFFSTPIFEGQAPDGSSSWTFNWEMFGLFARICFPMMFVTLLLWGMWTVYRSPSREKEVSGDDVC